MSTLRTDFTSITRVDFLYPDGSVAHSITDDVIQDGSTLNVAFQKTGSRRTATLVVDNWKGIYDLHPDKLWFGQQIKISMGVLLPDGTEYLLPQGVFYVSNPNEVYYPSERTTTLSLVDKWAALDGSVFGYFSDMYKLTSGVNLYTALQQMLLTDRGNGFPLDNIPPILSRRLLTKTYQVDLTTYNYIDCPYTAKIGGSYADVANEINTMLVSTMGYDPIGQLRVEPANADIADNYRSVLWNFSTSERELIGMRMNSHPETLYNHVVVTGGTLNGHVARGEATDTDPRSPTSVLRIGKKTAPSEEQSKYYADAQCKELADYRLSQYKKLATEATIECSPLFHLQENCLVTVWKDGYVPYLVSAWSLPLGQTGTMSITASKLDIPADNRYLAPTIVDYYSGTLYSGAR